MRGAVPAGFRPSRPRRRATDIGAHARAAKWSPSARQRARRTAEHLGGRGGDPAGPAPAPAPGLRAEQLEKLRELAAIGYVSGLRTQLDVFERESPGGADFSHLRALLAEYRMDAFLHALDEAGGTP